MGGSTCRRESLQEAKTSVFGSIRGSTLLHHCVLKPVETFVQLGLQLFEKALNLRAPLRLELERHVSLTALPL